MIKTLRTSFGQCTHCVQQAIVTNLLINHNLLKQLLVLDISNKPIDEMESSRWASTGKKIKTSKSDEISSSKEKIRKTK